MADDPDVLYRYPGCASSGSTDSLTSILHHDSYQDDLASSLDEDFESLDKVEKYELKYFLSTDEPVVHVHSVQSPNPPRRIKAPHIHIDIPRRPKLKPDLPVEATKPSEVTEKLLPSSENPKPMKRIVFRRQSHSSTSASATLDEDKSKSTKTRSSSARPSSRSNTNEASQRSQPSYSSDFSKSEESKSEQKQEIKPGNGRRKTWDEWFVQKEKMLRETRAQEMDKQRLERERQHREKEEKESKESLIKEKVDAWMKKKEKQTVSKNRQERSKKDIQQQEEERKKQEIQEKADRKYQEWLNSDRRKRHEMQVKEAKAAEEKAKTEAMKQEKAQKAFDKWIAEHSPQQHPPPYSYGYTDGKLTAYYDRGSAPPPSFVNPEPWLPPAEFFRRMVS